jgi:hypothetical protein
LNQTWDSGNKEEQRLEPNQQRTSLNQQKGKDDQ